MRMNERGLGTGAIVGIVVAVVAIVVVVVAAVLLLGGGGPGGLPVYSGATKVGGDVSYMGATVSVYTFTDSAQTVYNWYKNNVPAGWTLHYESGYVENYGGSITYEKGTDYGYAVILEGSYAQAYGGSKVLLLGVVPKTAVTP